MLYAHKTQTLMSGTLDTCDDGGDADDEAIEKYVKQFINH